LLVHRKDERRLGGVRDRWRGGKVDVAILCEEVCLEVV
jgi:hypothetical protein